MQISKINGLFEKKKEFINRHFKLINQLIDLTVSNIRPDLSKINGTGVGSPAQEVAFIQQQEEESYKRAYEQLVKKNEELAKILNVMKNETKLQQQESSKDFEEAQDFIKAVKAFANQVDF